MTKDRYQGAHARIRKATLPYAYGTPCVRCGEIMLPGQPLHLDHDDDDLGRYLGYAHAGCNVRAGAAKGGRERARRARERKLRTVCMGEIAVGVEISQDRQHTAIGTAAALDDGAVLIDVLHYLDGTSTAVEAVRSMDRDGGGGRRRQVEPYEVADPAAQGRRYHRAGVADHRRRCGAHAVA